MDRIDAMRVLARIVECGSFSGAALDLGMPRSTVTQGIKELEARLGVRLLERTTRRVWATLDGEAYYRRCLAIIADIEESEAAFTGAKPKGLVRFDVHGTLARYFVLPGLPAFLERYPGIQLHLTEGNRFGDLVREGIDCILRVGQLPDSSLVGRRIATLDTGTFASADYLARFGKPSTPDGLRGHRMIGYTRYVDGGIVPLEFTVEGKLKRMTLPSAVVVTGAENNVASACLGLGLIQVPRYRVASELAAKNLVEVLADFPPPPLPVHVLYPHNRQLSPRVRIFVDWLASEFAARPETRGQKGH